MIEPVFDLFSLENPSEVRSKRIHLHMMRIDRWIDRVRMDRLRLPRQNTGSLPML